MSLVASPTFREVRKENVSQHDAASAELHGDVTPGDVFVKPVRSEENWAENDGFHIFGMVLTGFLTMMDLIEKTGGTFGEGHWALEQPTFFGLGHET